MVPSLHINRLGKEQSQRLIEIFLFYESASYPGGWQSMSYQGRGLGIHSRAVDTRESLCVSQAEGFPMLALRRLARLETWSGLRRPRTEAQSFCLPRRANRAVKLSGKVKRSLNEWAY